MVNILPTALPFQPRLVTRDWLGSSAFELILEKPDGFDFRPGQKVMLSLGADSREYSLVSAPSEESLSFCIRLVEEGTMSNRLATMPPGQQLKMSAAYGFFLYRKGRAVFVATGTGVAPFVSYCRSGIRDFIMLHGVSDPKELYYRDTLQRNALQYTACISGSGERGREKKLYYGRVTRYLSERLREGEYTFYLCGNGEMIRDAMQIIDNLYPDAKIFTETFYH